MSQLATDSPRAITPSQRSHVLAEAVVSAYIDEIARSARPLRRAAVSPARRHSPAATPIEVASDEHGSRLATRRRLSPAGRTRRAPARA
jgi:hypothetical protein